MDSVCTRQDVPPKPRVYSFQDMPLRARSNNWTLRGPFDSATGQWSAPEGTIDVPTDMLAVIDKFINKFGAPSTARTDIAPALPDGRIDMIPDLVYVIDAFRGLPYPFDAPEPCP